MIEAQPKTPTMVIERQRKGYANAEQDPQDCLLAKVGKEQTSEIRKQNDGLGRNHVRHDRTDEKSFLAFEDDAARSTTML